jgi:hypothetical protein
MRFIEWAALGLFVIAGYQQYQKQEFWLDRQVARFIGFLRREFSKLFSKGAAK